MKLKIAIAALIISHSAFAARAVVTGSSKNDDPNGYTCINLAPNLNPHEPANINVMENQELYGPHYEPSAPTTLTYGGFTGTYMSMETIVSPDGKILTDNGTANGSALAGEAKCPPMKTANGQTGCNISLTAYLPQLASYYKVAFFHNGKGKLAKVKMISRNGSSVFACTNDYIVVSVK